MTPTTGFVAQIRRHGETFAHPLNDSDSIVYAGIVLANELSAKYPDGDYEVLAITPRERLVDGQGADGARAKDSSFIAE